MQEVKNYSFGIETGTREELCFYLWMDEYRRDGAKWTNIIAINVDDALKMVEDRTWYSLHNQTKKLMPIQIKDFDIYLAAFVQSVYQTTDLISNAEYWDFCRARLNLYANYKSDKEIYEHFFRDT